MHGTRLHLDPDATMAVILSSARKAGEPLQVTKYVVAHELAAIGVLRTETISGGTRYTCTVPDPSGAGGQVKRWDLDADRIFHEPDPEPAPGPTGPAAGSGRPRPCRYPTRTLPSDHRQRCGRRHRAPGRRG